MTNDKDTTPDDLAVDDLDTVAGGTGNAIGVAMSEACHDTMTPERPL